MQDFVNLVLLVLASIAAMLLGVLAAYALIKTGFSLMQWHSQHQAPATKTQTQIVSAS
jgi:hypothetical protein